MLSISNIASMSENKDFCTRLLISHFVQGVYESMV